MKVLAAESVADAESTLLSPQETAGKAPRLAEERAHEALRQRKEKLLHLLRERQGHRPIDRKIAPVERETTQPPCLDGMREESLRQYLNQLLQNSSGNLAAISSRLPELSEQQCRALAKKLLQRMWQGATKATLSYAQQRCWFFDLLHPGSPAQNIAAAVRARGLLDIELLERSLNRIVARHETLRTNFMASSDGPMQVIVPARELKITQHDLVGALRRHGEQVMYDALRNEAYRPFNLGAGSLLRVDSFKTGPFDHVLLLTIHHIIADEWSISVLIEELSRLYQTRCQEPLPPLAVQYADYAKWQAREITASAVQSELAYWRRQLAGASFVLEVPTDRARPALQTNNGAAETLLLPQHLVQTLKQLAKGAECTGFMAMLAVFYVLLYIRTGRLDMLVGTDFANRNRPETKDLVGFFVNELALRCNLEGDPSFREILRRVRSTALGGFSHPETPFQWVVENLKLVRDPSRAPVFQVVFDLHNMPMRLDLNGIVLEALRLPLRPAKFDLTLFISDTGVETQALLEYNTDLYDRQTAVALLEDYVKVLEVLTSSPWLRLSELSSALRRGGPDAG